MRDANRNLLLRSAAAAALLLALTGCVTETRTEMKANAENRWARTRGDIHYGLAKQQFEIGDLEKAEVTILQAVETKPDEARYHVLAARIMMERGALERAHIVLTRAIEMEQQVPAERGGPNAANLADAHYQLGLVQQRWQRYEQALDAYDKAYSYERDQPRGLLAAAEMLVKLGRADEALARLGEKVVYFENNPGIRVAIARIHTLKGDHAKAVSAYREAALLANQDPHLLERLARAEHAAEQYADAARRLESLLAIDGFKNRHDLRDLLGDCQMALGKTAAARDQYLLVAQANEGDAAAWIKVGQASWMLGDRVRSSEAARRIITLAPDRHEGYLLRGMIEQDAGRPQAALAQFNRAVKLAPNASSPWLMRGMALERLGNRDGAIDSYQRAAAAAPDDPRPRQLIAGLLE